MKLFISKLYKIVLCLLVCSMLLLFATAPITAETASNQYKAKKHHSETHKDTQLLVIHSLPQEGQEQYLAALDDLLEIITSHWNVTVTIENYMDSRETNLQAYDHILLIELNNESFAADYFANIVATTTAKTLWLGYGTQLVATGRDNSGSQGEPVTAVLYKDISFEANELRLLTVHTTQSPNFKTLATAVTDSGNEYPLISVVNDRHVLMPFGIPYYFETNTYTLPFLDALHHFLGHHERLEKQPALMRLEDVNVYTYRNPYQLQDVYTYLLRAGIPFHIAFIERYVNPELGIDWDSGRSKRYLNIIKQMVMNGDAVLVQHGYTHQVGDEVSGIGYEFWDAQKNAPLETDTPEYALDKVHRARAAMEVLELPVPDIWETPHYAQSDTADAVFNQIYPIRYEHIHEIGSLPFVATIRGTIYLPENLGYIFREATDLADIEYRLKQLNTFEDPVASGFWHPWREADELEQYITLVQRYNFQFVHGYDLLTTATEQELTAVMLTLVDRIHRDDVVFYFLLTAFTVGALVYARNVFRLKKHVKLIKNFSLSMTELQDLARNKQAVLPKIGIFVPARGEALVIENTLKNVARIEYPKTKMRVFVIVDERELDDNLPVTTKAIARAVATKLNTRYKQKFIHIIEVPKWFSGSYGSTKKTYAPSTKGRALNYCLQKIGRFRLAMVGVLDADGRLHTDVLKEVAYRRIQDNSKILQGSVFQVSNFSKVTIVGVAAGLELALHHLTELPHRLMQQGVLQFLAGTNYFVDCASIKKAGGWDQDALVEDAELAVRLYLSENIVGEWLHTPELEQTPARFSIYRKQRERWVRGHIAILKQIYYSQLPFKEKLYFGNKIVASQFRFILDLGLPVLSLVLLFSGVFISMNMIVFYFSLLLFGVSFFVWDTYGMVYRTLAGYIDQDMDTKQKLSMSVQLFAFLPVFIIVQFIPRVEAMYNALLYPEKTSWYKTERTAEAEIQ